ncbi:MAG: helix-turn-helix domain-containing protein [Rubrivivax sp.]|nr:helix-turn-helix domain-containing protein [Rubrivivax sp.]
MITEPPPSDLNARIAEQVRLLRRQRGLSLEDLAARSGVSRSMISVIERGESSATAVVLERLATGLGVALASLFDRPDAPASPLARRDEQPTWRDPQSGYLRRNVSPPGFTAPLRIVEVLFPPLARVAYETAEREVPVHQQVWVLEGRLQVGTGGQQHELGPGDCLAMTLDAPTLFHNPGPQTTRYAVVLNVASEPRR